jgi:hypothetical protein
MPCEQLLGDFADAAPCHTLSHDWTGQGDSFSSCL